MAILHFLLGLGLGLLLMIWQRSRFEARLQKILRSLKSDVGDASVSSVSQLAFAVSEQHRLNSVLRQQLEIDRQIIQNCPVSYLQVDDENRLMLCNVAAQSLLGIAAQDSAEEPRLLLELVRSYELDDLIERSRAAGKLCQSDWTLYPVSEDPSFLSTQTPLAVRGYGFPLLGYQVGIFLENRQETVAILQQRDRWTSDLAHEFKTPLTSIRLVAETLQPRLDPTLRTWLDRLIGETIRLSNLVQDVLDLNQQQRNSHQQLQRELTDLPDLVQAVWHSLEPLVRKKQLSLMYEGPTHLQTEVDRARIHRLLINLLDNSIKHSPIGGVVQVKLSRLAAETDPAATGSASSSAQICLEVIDMGPGFPEQALPHVFERFYRADPSRSRLDSDRSLTPDRFANRAYPDGSGLGLAIVQQIITAHQGTVTAANHPETGGAWLSVYLPDCPADALLPR